MLTREMIIKEARTWLGTRFHHQGRKKKNSYNDGGCDCLGLLIGVARELNISSGITNNNTPIPLYKYDCQHYGRKISGNILSDHLHKFMNVKEEIELGDVMLFKIQNRLQHLGFYSYHHAVIHSLLAARKVVEHPIDDYWQKNIAAIFSFKEIQS